MGPAEFKPPQNDEEFKARAATVTTEGARAVLNSLKHRRAALVKNIDEEIEFYERILKEREES